MAWFVFALLSALFYSLKDALSKSGLRDTDEYVVAWAFRFFTFLFLMPVLALAGIPPLGGSFILVLLAGGLLDAAATVLFMKALKSSDLSLIIPLGTFTPLFMLITSPLIMGEFPTALGLAGMLLIVAGSYTLNTREGKSSGYLAPFRAFLHQKGPRYMLIVTLIYSITANFDKIGVQNSSPLFWPLASNLFISLVLFPLMLHKSSKNVSQVPRRLKSFIPIGIFNALQMAFHMIALSLTLAAYVISVKRIDAVISVLLGRSLFKERHVRERLLGAAIMVLGVALIALS